MGKKRTPTPEDHEKLAAAQRRDQMGDIPGALAGYEELARKFPEQADLHFAAGYAALRLSDLKSALSRFERAVALDPRAIQYHSMRALTLSALSRIGEGLTSIERALAIRSEDPTALFIKAELLRLDGRHREALDLLEPRMDRLREFPDAVGAFAQVAAACGKTDEALAALRTSLAKPGIPDDGRCKMLFRLGAILDKRGEHDEAWAAFEEANRLKHVRYDPAQEERSAQERFRVWTRERLASLPRPRETSELPVFIVGLPRSGTTLVEQIIATHPKGYGGGEREMIPRCGQELFRGVLKGKSEERCLSEVTPGLVDRLARRELKDMRREAGPQVERFTDKMMSNFRHLGIVEMLFPGARVIHVRRDPLDNCLSCYFQHFPGLNGQPFAYDLGHLAFYHKLSERFMAHWREVLSIPILDVCYEELVADQEAQTRRLIEFLGLEWDDACLEFHKTKRDVVTLSTEQVRKPMYRSSVARHEKYAKHLAPLREALGME